MITEKNTLHFGSPQRGAFHRYREVGGVWTHVDSFANPGFGSANGFGYAVGFEGDLVAVGAPFESVQGLSRGAVYLFRFTNRQWQQEAQLVASDGEQGDYFGTAVALDYGRVVVGAHDKLVNGISEGAAYAFEQVGGAWLETGRFAPDAGANDFHFGVSVDINGATAVVGATRTNDPGAVYAFVDTGAGWVREARLQPTGLGSFATLGHSVAVSGDTLVAGAYQDSAAGNLTGSAWVFERGAGTWTPTVRLVNTGTQPGFHGRGVRLDGAGNFVVGEPYAGLGGLPATSGIIHFYRPERSVGTTYCSAVANSTQITGGIDALGSALVVDDQVTLVAFNLPDNSFGFFITSRTTATIHQPGGSLGVLCVGGAIGRYVGPGQIRNTGSVGSFGLVLDLGTTPTPTGLVAIAPGETWHFQTWHRDSVGGLATSNFTNAISVTFQ